jgi:hypothetical protein
VNTKHNAVAWIHHRGSDPVFGDAYSPIPFDALTDYRPEIDRWINEGGAVGPRLAIENMPRAPAVDSTTTTEFS